MSARHGQPCRLSAIFFLLILVVSALTHAQAQGNTDPAYQALRSIGLSGEGVGVNNLVLKRDVARFTLRSGSLCFLAPVNGKVTGAVFMGEGQLSLDPPLAVERRSLAVLTRGREYVEHFSEMTLRFTDGTYDEVKKLAGSGSSSACSNGGGLLEDTKTITRKHIYYNLSARILADVLSPEPGGLFVAFIKGKDFDDKTILMMDPQGAPEVSPEEISLTTWDPDKRGIWAAFHYAGEYTSGRASSAERNGSIRVEQQVIDTTVEKNAALTGKAATSFVATRPGVRVVPLNLFPTLRVTKVAGSDGSALPYIQEDKREDADFWVILPKPLAAGEKFTLTSEYTGKEAVQNEGGGNYYPVGRENWYPNQVGSEFGNYATYDLTFCVPKGMKIAATGTPLGETSEGGQTISHWKSDGPLTVAGFNFGQFKREETKLDKLDVTVETDANPNPPDIVQSIQHAASGDYLPQQGGFHGGAGVALGSMDTTSLMKKAMAEGQFAMGLYTDYFGPLPIKRLAMTQQTAFSYGQSWPGLVWLPITYFFDNTVRHELGFKDAAAYFRVVAPHEVAHQWWGHQVGFNSYRDQWMSEGFADLSASIYLQAVYNKNPKEYLNFWREEKELLLERNKEGVRAIDAGPLTLGYRLSNSRQGYDVTRRLIYPKGAFVLHMLRMMLWSNQSGDAEFKKMMHDFATTYAGKAATTEDFKHVVEKHMTQEMTGLAGGNSMDWFFDEYVYGTALPAYDNASSIETDAQGAAVLHLKLTQSGVDDNFRMLVPIYLELADGRMAMLGRARLIGNSSFEQRVPLSSFKEKPRRVVVNYNYDVLAAN